MFSTNIKNLNVRITSEENENSDSETQSETQSESKTKDQSKSKTKDQSDDDSDSDEENNSSDSEDDNDRSSDPFVKYDTPDELEKLQADLEAYSITHETFNIPPLYDDILINCSPTKLAEVYYRVERKWFGEDIRNRKWPGNSFAHYIFSLSPDKFYTEETIKKSYAKHLAELSALKCQFDMLSNYIEESENKKWSEIMKNFPRLFAALYEANSTLLSEFRLKNILTAQYENSSDPTETLFAFSSQDVNTLNSVQQLILFTLGRCYENKYRKFDDMLCIEKKVTLRDRKTKEKKEYATRSFEPLMSIKDFIITEANPNTNWNIWLCTTDGNALDNAVKNLKACIDPRLPFVAKHRTVSAWKNGLWIADCQSFVDYRDQVIPEGIVATVFIDQDFDTRIYGDNDDFMDIPCVAKHILGCQGYNNEEISFILGVCFGRLIFKPGMYERWEVIPFLFGQGQTGKSCLVEACARLFHKDDVAGISNSIERIFGLSPLLGKKLAVANDVRKNFALDAGDIQTIVSLELMSIAIKNKTAACQNWDVPVIFAGNEIPKNWTSSLRSLERRIMLIPFENRVTRDDKVKIELEKNRSNFYRIITCAYHYWVRRCGSQNVWDHAPKKIIEAKKIIQENENPLESFFNSPEVIITHNKNHYVEEEALLNRFRQVSKMVSFTNKRLMEQVLRTRGVKKEFLALEWPIDFNEKKSPDKDKKTSVDDKEKPNNIQHKRFYMGMRLKFDTPLKKKTPEETSQSELNKHIYGNYQNKKPSSATSARK